VHVSTKKDDARDGLFQQSTRSYERCQENSDQSSSGLKKLYEHIFKTKKFKSGSGGECDLSHLIAFLFPEHYSR
jgi:hypothetical protein